MVTGAPSYTRTIFDEFGRVYEISAPDIAIAPSFYTTTDYDLVGRPEQTYRQVDAGNSTLQYTIYDYEGLTTTTTDAEGKVSKTILDALGRTYRSIDHDSYYQQFEYDSFGSLREVKDSLGNTLQKFTYGYGIEAFRESSDDMDLGLWAYTPNALGEVVGHTDAKSQSFTAEFDKLSRPTKRTAPDNTTIWTWGASAALNNIGRLESVSSSGHSESYAYDSKGRPSQITTVADTTYLINYTYSTTTGLLDTLTYPETVPGSRIRLKYDYQHGSPNKISNAYAPTQVFWTLDAVDARGNVVAETFGNTLETIKNFDAVTGLPDFAQSGPGGGSARQDLEFWWDKVGNLTKREDLNRSLEEEFFYDNLHRLDYSLLNTSVQNLDMSYDLMGNITYKDDVGSGTWTYHADKKHAVINASGNTFDYDDNGNQIKRNTDDITWTSYNYPSRVENGSKYHDYFYDANRMRWKQVYNDGTADHTTIFVGGIFEKYTSGSSTQYRNLISVGGRPIVQITRYTGGGTSIEVLLTDHLGSVSEVIDWGANVDASESFDAYGQRRDPVDWDGPINAADKAAIADSTPHGYTFHTNMEESSLIHMNGRIADGFTGRFLSPDPYVFDPSNTQEFNRYSYVRNRPLTFTDPTGFCIEPISCGALIEGIITSIGLDSLFGGKRKKTPPRGCWVPGGGTGCYGVASTTKLFSMANDLLRLYDLVKYGRVGVRFGGFGMGGLSAGGFGTGVCPEYMGPNCMSWDDEDFDSLRSENFQYPAGHIILWQLMSIEDRYERNERMWAASTEVLQIAKGLQDDATVSMVWGTTDPIAIQNIRDDIQSQMAVLSHELRLMSSSSMLGMRPGSIADGVVTSTVSYVGTEYAKYEMSKSIRRRVISELLGIGVDVALFIDQFGIPQGYQNSYQCGPDFGKYLCAIDELE